jgi:hypothetical protein
LLGVEDAFLFLRLPPAGTAMTEALSSAVDYLSGTKRAVDEQQDRLAELVQDSERELG